MSFIIRDFGLQPYAKTHQAMHEFTQQRDAQTPDEIWFVEHFPIYTLGKTALKSHLLKETAIPIFQSDRGGQITFHAPGQQIMYVLIDLKRAQRQVRDVVSALENAVIETLRAYAIGAHAKKEAPGVYVGDKKIASLGLNIQKRCTLHGLALNIDMDLAPFSDINPCGYEGLLMTQLSDLTQNIDRTHIQKQLQTAFLFSFTSKSE